MCGEWPQAELTLVTTRRDGQLAAYQETVLKALEETENALAGFRAANQAEDELRLGAEAATEAARLAHSALARDPRFLELGRHQPRGERRGIERHAQFRREIGHRADVVFVPVGDDDRVELGRLFPGHQRHEPVLFVFAREQPDRHDQPDLAFVNVPLETLKDLAKRSLLDSNAVWFGCDALAPPVIIRQRPACQYRTTGR